MKTNARSALHCATALALALALAGVGCGGEPIDDEYGEDIAGEAEEVASTDEALGEGVAACLPDLKPEIVNAPCADSQVKWRICNKGCKGAPKSYAWVEFDGELKVSRAIDPLNPGQCSPIITTWIPVQPDRTVGYKVIADPQNKVAESKELNNESGGWCDWN